MNKEQFLRQLGEKLAALPHSEVQRSLNFYEEIINDRMEDGMTEEEAVSSLDVNLIAERIIVDNTPLPTLVKARVDEKKQQQKAKGSGNAGVWTTILLILGFPLWFPILAAVGAVILACYGVIWAMIIAIFAVLLSLGVAALACFIAIFLCFPYNGLAALACFGGALILAGLAILAWFPIYWGAKALFQLTKKAGKAIGRKVKSLFIKKERK